MTNLPSTAFNVNRPIGRVALSFNYVAPPIDKEIQPPTLGAAMIVSPLTGLISSGEQGGPFDYYSAIYTVANVGGIPLDWTATPSESWISVDIASGTLGVGESINVTITSDSDSLPIGLFSGSVSFVNTTSGIGDATVQVSASVSGEYALSMEERSLAGTATLVGHDEFTSPSSPPKKYLVKTLSGELRICNYGTGGTCPSTLAGNNEQRSRKYEGAETYNAVTGVMTTNTKQYLDNGNVACNQPPSYSLNIGFNPSTATETATLGTWLNRTITQTSIVQTTDGTCVKPGLFVGSNAGKVTMCTARDDLSVEDTEQNAIDRMVNSGSWSSWGGVVSIGDAVTGIEQRTSGFSFSASQGQIRCSGSGLAPSYAYSGTVDIYRRDYGTADPWVFVGTSPISGTTDGSGNITITEDIDGVAGYEYSAFNAKLIVP